MSAEETTEKQRVIMVRDALAAMFPARIVTRNLLSYEDRNQDELRKGIFTVVSGGVADYRNYNGREAMDGNHRIFLFAQIMVEEDHNGEAVEDAEFDMVEDVKAFLRARPPVRPAELCCLVATGYEQTGQIDAPYGAVRFNLENRDA